MQATHNEIIRRYKTIAHLPDFFIRIHFSIKAQICSNAQGSARAGSFGGGLQQRCKLCISFADSRGYQSGGGCVKDFRIEQHGPGIMHLVAGIK